jgi:agmatine/peptidylarginine deiminase
MRRSILVLLVLLGAPWAALAQNGVPLGLARQALDFESQEEAVVLLAIGEVRVPPALTPNFAKIQKDIAKAAVEVANVIVFIDEHIDHYAVQNAFRAEPVLAKAITEGRLLFSVVPHDSSWIRDYGPQLKPGPNGSFVLVDSKYKDIRAEMETERSRKRINVARQNLITTFSKKNPGVILGTAPIKVPAVELTDLKDRLYILQQWDDILVNGKLNDRNDDDYSPFEIMQAVTGSAEISVERPELYLDGGNLLRLTDGRLITTKELFLRNRDKENVLTDQLKKHFSVKDVVYLDPLPGKVIRHVDMFLLPAAGKRVWLASYEGMAAEAMQKNKARLVQLGYQVIDVPSLPPQVQNNKDYYPTLLNALTLRTKSGGYAILVPYYPQLDPYVQFAAHKEIRKAFGGNGVNIIPVDCSTIAPLQGAVHCVTATVPARFSMFAKAARVARK